MAKLAVSADEMNVADSNFASEVTPLCEKYTILDKENVNALLANYYRPEYIYIEKAELCNNCLLVVFKTFEYPYSWLNIDHLTREHATLFVTQAAYVLGAELARSGNFYPLNIEKYLAAISAEKAVFSRISLNFKKFIKNQDGILLRIWCTDYGKVGTNILGKMSFEFEKGECYGECEVFITY